jgi:hypothetical protein
MHFMCESLKRVVQINRPYERSFKIGSSLSFGLGVTSFKFNADYKDAKTEMR